MPYAILLLILSILTCLSGCGLIYQYDNCPDDATETFTIDTDWSKATDAYPEGMAYIFFADNNTDIWRFDFPGREGGPANLPNGHYHVLSFNDDTSGVMFIHTNSFDNYTCTCRKAGLYDGLGGSIDHMIGPDSINGEPVTIYPDMMWGESVPDFILHMSGTDIRRLDSSGIRSYPYRRLTFIPSQLTPRFHYIISDIKNLDGVKQMCASISGMASALRLADMHRSDTTVTLPLEATRISATAVSGDFCSYGTPDNSPPSNTLTLYVWLTDGRKFKYEFNVTQQIVSAPDPMDITISVSGIDIPESDGTTGDGGGFDVSVDGWSTIVINIKS